MLPAFILHGEVYFFLSWTSIASSNTIIMTTTIKTPLSHYLNKKSKRTIPSGIKSNKSAITVRIESIHPPTTLDFSPDCYSGRSLTGTGQGPALSHNR